MLTAPIEWQLIAKVVIWFFQQYADIFYKGKWFLKKTQNEDIFGAKRKNGRGEDCKWREAGRRP